MNLIATILARLKKPPGKNRMKLKNDLLLTIGLHVRLVRRDGTKRDYHLTSNPDIQGNIRELKEYIRLEHANLSFSEHQYQKFPWLKDAMNGK